MSDDIEKLEDLYERLYEVSKQIAELLDRELYDELVKYFQKKDQLLAEASTVIDNMKVKTASDKLRDFADKYQKQELENLKVLTKIKEETRVELLKTSQNAKLAGAYRANREDIHGNILDFSE